MKSVLMPFSDMNVAPGDTFTSKKGFATPLLFHPLLYTCKRLGMLRSISVPPLEKSWTLCFPWTNTQTQRVWHGSRAFAFRRWWLACSSLRASAQHSLWTDECTHGIHACTHCTPCLAHAPRPSHPLSPLHMHHQRAGQEGQEGGRGTNHAGLLRVCCHRLWWVVLQACLGWWALCARTLVASPALISPESLLHVVLDTRVVLHAC